MADLFPDSEQVKRLGLMQSADAAIWVYARQHGFCIVTQDEDYAELSLLRGAPPSVILLRTGNLRTAEVAELLRRRAALIQDALAPGSETYCLTLFS